MNKMLMAAGLAIAAAAAHADVLELPAAKAESPAAEGTAPQPSVDLKRGSSMAQIEAELGAPATKRPAVGGGAPAQPRIVRWDYPGFSVFFEVDRLIDVVVHDSPKPITPPQAQ